MQSLAAAAHQPCAGRPAEAPSARPGPCGLGRSMIAEGAPPVDRPAGRVDQDQDHRSSLGRVRQTGSENSVPHRLDPVARVQLGAEAVVVQVMSLGDLDPVPAVRAGPVTGARVRRADRAAGRDVGEDGAAGGDLGAVWGSAHTPTMHPAGTELGRDTPVAVRSRCRRTPRPSRARPPGSRRAVARPGAAAPLREGRASGRTR